MREDYPRQSGQALLLVVVMMGGVLFLVTAVAGLLMYYQVQQSNDVANSTIAIFAADAALERGLFYYFYEYTPGQCTSFPCILVTSNPIPPLTFSNGASASTTIVIPDPASFNVPVTVAGSGKDARAHTIRSLEMNFVINP